jgi:hypothetical protein
MLIMLLPLRKRLERDRMKLCRREGVGESMTLIGIRPLDKIRDPEILPGDSVIISRRTEVICSETSGMIGENRNGTVNGVTSPHSFEHRPKKKDWKDKLTGIAQFDS